MPVNASSEPDWLPGALTGKGLDGGLWAIGGLEIERNRVEVIRQTAVNISIDWEVLVWESQRYEARKMSYSKGQRGN